MSDDMQERFERETAEHELAVLRDDGLYRHLRCRKPGTGMYGFDIVTWPGYLAVVGDCGDFVFSRLSDMFEFFESSGRINPHYWSEKLQAPGPSGAERYSREKFQARVREWLAYTCEGLGEDDAASLRDAVRDLVDRAPDNEHDAHRALQHFEHNGCYFGDSWEWNLRDYDWQFLWCCHAIVWAIGKYRAATTEAVAA